MTEQKKGNINKKERFINYVTIYEIRLYVNFYIV